LIADASGESGGVVVVMGAAIVVVDPLDAGRPLDSSCVVAVSSVADVATGDVE
jgi:hypothetical protein